MLPKILITDPVVQVIKETERAHDASGEDEEHVPLPTGWLADRVLKVIRPSPSAGVSVAYRLIVEGSEMSDNMKEIIESFSENVA